MGRKIRLFRFAGWEWSTDWTIIPGAVILVVFFSVLAAATVNLPAGEAVIAGILGMMIHYLGDVIHNLGHSIAARRVGYPMRGIHIFTILVGSIYPRDEPPLPGKIHIQRALGGPLISLVVTGIMGILMVLVWENGGIPRFLTTLAFLDNLIILTIGALVPPLRFGWFSNDGGTILTWWGK